MPINKDLATAIKKAKSTPMMFAFVAKGAGGSLLVDRKIPPADIAAAKKEQGGGTEFKGRCFGEGGKMIFEVAKQPPGSLATQLKNALKEVGVPMNVEVRVNENAEAEGSQVPGAPVTDQAAAFVARLKVVLPAYQKAVQSPDASHVTSLKNNFTVMQTAFKAQDFDAAHGHLEALVKLLAGPAAPAPQGGAEQLAPQGGAGQPAVDAGQFKNRLKQITPLYEKAKPGNAALPGLMAQAVGAAQRGEFAVGVGLLEELVAQIKAGLRAAPAAPPPANGAAPAATVAQFKERLKQLTPQYEAAKVTVADLPALMVQALGAAKKGQFDAALQHLDQLAARLEAAAGAAPEAGGRAEQKGPADGEIRPGIVDFTTAILKWDQAMNAARNGLQQFKSALLADFPNQAAQVTKLDSMLDDLAKFKDEVRNPLDEATNAATEPQRKALYRQALRVVRQQLRTIEEDERFDAIDNDPANPYAGIKVGEPLIEVLEELEIRLDV